MYCIKCGVKLADTETKCPLCNTVVYHPDFEQKAEQPLYPANKMPVVKSAAKALNGMVVILFLIPLLACFFADFELDGKIEWFGFVAGAMSVSYITFALPIWFKKPNPVIFIPCDFAALALYMQYVNFATNGNWYMSFALPLICGIALIICTVVTLIYYLKKGKLYIIGGAFIALGAFMFPLELLMKTTFNLKFVGWSIYPLSVLLLFGCLLIYLAINSTAREIIKRKMFF